MSDFVSVCLSVWLPIVFPTCLSEIVAPCLTDHPPIRIREASENDNDVSGLKPYWNKFTVRAVEMRVTVCLNEKLIIVVIKASVEWTDDLEQRTESRLCWSVPLSALKSAFKLIWFCLICHFVRVICHSVTQPSHFEELSCFLFIVTTRVRHRISLDLFVLSVNHTGHLNLMKRKGQGWFCN